MLQKGCNQHKLNERSSQTYLNPLIFLLSLQDESFSGGSTWESLHPFWLTAVMFFHSFSKEYISPFSPWLCRKNSMQVKCFFCIWIIFQQSFGWLILKSDDWFLTPKIFALTWLDCGWDFSLTFLVGYKYLKDSLIPVAYARNIWKMIHLMKD